ncbi:MAG: sulfite exporter TauE/SafE family protein [Pseudomonadota bacterium]
MLGLEVWVLVAAAAVFVLGGYVKGAIGFALPLIAVSGSATLVDAQTAVGMIVLPVLLSNLVQAFRQGVAALLVTARRFWPGIAVMMVVILASAQLLTLLSDRVFFLTLGVGAGLFAVLQLAGWRPVIQAARERVWGLGVGLIAGFYGGLSGIWGPPYVLYITALRLPPKDQVRATGLCFLCGSLMFAPSHVVTGVLNERTALLSALMVPATLLGQYFGQRTQDRLDANLFRRITLIVLLLSSINLIRRGLF